MRAYEGMGLATCSRGFDALCHSLCFDYCCLQTRHVQQIRALCPGTLDWEYVLTTNTITTKQEQQLLIKMPTNKTKQSFDTAQMQQTFFKALQQLAQKHQVSRQTSLAD